MKRVQIRAKTLIGALANKFLQANRSSQILFVILCVVLLLILWDTSCPQYRCLKYKDTKYVLFWDDLYLEDELFAYDAVGYDMFKDCEYSNCFASIDRTLRPVEQFDAIVFHGDLYSGKDYEFPDRRSYGQRYIYYNLNAPDAVPPRNAEKFVDFFNWTMTYRLDSDIPIPYGRTRQIYDRDYFNPPNLRDLSTEKTKIAAWIPTKCDSTVQRESFVKKLQKHFPVHVFGECGTFTCSNTLKDDEGSCTNVLSHYKFVLTFESVYCVDLISKRLWQTLNDLDYVVPIVRGGADYKKLLPPGSFVDATEFKDSKDLAKYLIYLSTHDDEFLRYFKWRHYYVVEDVRLPCELCKKLQMGSSWRDGGGAKKVYRNIDEWWRGKSGGRTCGMLRRWLNS